MRGILCIVGTSGWLRLAAATAGGLVVAATAGPATAQSAADKATARRLATEAIKLYNDEKYAEALDRMQRAQALYDAPIHLLYIARAQVKTGKVVEGAETYRGLARTQLDAGAPAVFREAVDNAKQELREVEPSIPALKIVIEPEGVTDLMVKLDGQEISSAVVGVERPTNPGEHTVVASAPGFVEKTETVELDLGEREELTLKLEPTAGDAEGGGGAAGPGGKGGGEGGSQPPAATGSTGGSFVGFMAGLRLGGAVPGGSLATVGAASAGPFGAAGGETVATEDVFKPGGGGELHIGIRFGKYVSAVLFGGSYRLSPGPLLDEPPPGTPSGDVEVTNNTSAEEIGLGVIAGTAPGRFGFFGELDLTRRSFGASQDISALGTECNATVTLSGSSVRLGGGARIPVAKIFELTPVVLFSVGSLAEWDLESDCPGVISQSGDLESAETSSMVFVGVGGDFLFGGQKASD